MTNTTTTDKVRARIAAHMATDSTVMDAVTNAFNEAVTEARAMGWNEQTIAGMMFVFSDVGADMVADAIIAIEGAQA